MQATLFKKKALAQVFPVNFAKILKTHFAEQLRATTSVQLSNLTQHYQGFI